MEKDLLELEEELRSFAPTALSGEVLSRMVSAMENWEEIPTGQLSDSLGGKVVAFPSEPKARRSSWHPTWAAAAAVAILGATGALLFPNGSQSNVTAMGALGPVPLLRQASLIPVKAERNVSSVTTGMTENRQGMPYQVIRVVRQEETNFQGADNVGLKISRPIVDCFVVPVSY